MRNKSILIFLPVTTLLISAKPDPGAPQGPLYRYQNEIDSITMGAIEVDHITEIDIYLSFSATISDHEVKLYRKHPKSGEFELKETYSSTKQAFRWKVQYVENLSRTLFQVYDDDKLHFRIDYTSEGVKRSGYYYANFSSYETDSETIRIYNSKTSSYYSSSRAYVYGTETDHYAVNFNEHYVFHHDSLSGDYVFDEE